jgi:hypothetical protein
LTQVIAFGYSPGGEIIEWTGYAIACWSLPAAAFAIMTFCNLGPRAHHVRSHLIPMTHFTCHLSLPVILSILSITNGIIASLKTILAIGKQ